MSVILEYGRKTVIWLGKKHVCRRKGSSRKGSRGEAWWLTALWDGRRLKTGWGASVWETGTGSGVAKKWAASEKSSEKSLMVKEGSTGIKAGGLESEQNGPLAACIQEPWWTPVIWGYPLCTQEITPQSEWLIPLKCCCAGRIASDTFCCLERLRSAL